MVEAVGGGVGGCSATFGGTDESAPAKRVLRCFLASCSRNCLNCAVPEGMLPWRTRYPLSLGTH